MTDHSPELVDVIARLRQAKRRWLVRLLITWTCVLCAALLMALVLLGAVRLALPQFWTQDLRTWFISLRVRSGAGLIVPFLTLTSLIAASLPALMFWKRMNLRKLAIAADEIFGLQERISTVLDPALSGGLGPVRSALLQDAQRHAQNIDPTILVPVPIPRAAWWLPILAIAAAVLWLLPRSFGPSNAPMESADFPDGSSTAPMSSEIRQALSDRLLEISDLVAVEAKDRDDPLLGAIANTLEGLTQDVAGDTELSVAQLEAELSSISEYLDRAGLSAESLVPDDINDLLAVERGAVPGDLAPAGAIGNEGAGRAGLPQGRGAVKTEVALARPSGSMSENQESQAASEAAVSNQEAEWNAAPISEAQPTTEQSELHAEIQQRAISDGGVAEQQVEPGGQQEDGDSTPDGEGQPTNAQSDSFTELPRHAQGTTRTVDAQVTPLQGTAGDIRSPTASPRGQEHNSFPGQDRMAASGESPAALNGAKRTEVLIGHGRRNEGGQVRRTDRPEIVLTEIEDTLPPAYGLRWQASDEEPVLRPYLAPSLLEPVSEYFMRLHDSAPR